MSDLNKGEGSENKSKLKKLFFNWKVNFDDAVDPVFLIDDNCKITEANKAAIHYFNKPLAELLGMPCYKLLHGKDSQIEDCPYVKAKKSKNREEEEIFIKEKGTWVLATVEAIYDENRGVVGGVHIIKDVTDRKKAEQKVNEMNLTLKTIINTCPAAIIAVDETGNVIFWNSAAERIYGWKEKEVIQKANPIIPKEQWNLFIKRIKEEFRGENGVAFLELPALRKDGSLIFVDVSTAQLKDANGNVIGVMGISYDVTDRKKAEEALKKSKDLLEKTFSSMDCAIFVLDNESPPLILDSNPAATKIFSYEREEILGKTTEFLHVNKETLSEFQKMLYPAVEKQGSLSNFEFSMKRKNGEIFPSEHFVSPLEDPEGNRVGWVSVVRDISKRKEIEGALKESEEKYKGLANSITDLFFAMDKDLRYTFWNNASEKLIGIKEKDAIGKSVYDVFGRGNQTERAVKVYKNVLATRKAEVFENKYHLSGKDYYFEISVYPTKEGISVFCKDITNKKRAEDELKRKLMKFNIEDGNIYLAEEPSPNISLNAFEDLIKFGYKGIIISRASKEELKIKGDVELWWLAESVKDCIKPDVALIKDKIRELPEKSVVLIDRMDYLVTKNSFEEILSFVQNVKEIAHMNNLVIIFSIDSSILDEKQLRFFQKECRQIQPRELIKLPENMLEMLRVVYECNSKGSKPSLTELGKQLGLSKPTIRKDIGILQSFGYLIESEKGRQKAVELTDKGRNLFIG